MISSDICSIAPVIRSQAEHQSERMAIRYLRDGDSDGPIETVTFGELDRRARAVAAMLQGDSVGQERALLLFPPGIDFVAAFLGCLFGDVIAVPAFPPDPFRMERTLPRLRHIVRDCGARVVLTTEAIARAAASVLPQVPELASMRWIAVDAVDQRAADEWRAPRYTADTVAFLQYTSGSTGAPRGVMVTHGNLVANVDELSRLGRTFTESVSVSWLPCYHDMGLIGGVLMPLYGGFPAVLMAPYAFLQRPARWLQAISRFHGTVSPFPNFALDLATRKVSDTDRVAMDLRSWRTAWTGSEPVRQASLARFARAFASSGFDPRAYLPGYGLAEATLVVSGWRATDSHQHRSLAVDRHALSRRRVMPAATEDDALALVGCGQVIARHEVRIVDPESTRPCAPDEVGEIWVRGPSIARGYWNRPQESAATFDARLAGTDGDGFLRTGDLGFLHQDELFITGRLKDMIIIRGANHYPQDIEATVEGAHACLRPGASAAVSLTREDEECLGVVAEVQDGLDADALEAVAGAIRSAVAGAHGVAPHTIALLPAGRLPKTSSGKLQRHACREGLEASSLAALFRSTPALAARPEGGVRTGVIDILAHTTGYAREHLRPEARLVAYLGLDSLLLASIHNQLEKAFGPLGRIGRALSDADATVEDLVRYVEAHASAPPLDSQIAAINTAVAAPAPAPEPPPPARGPVQDRLEAFHEVRELRSTLLMFPALQIENPFFRVLEGPARDRVTIDGSEQLNFATYNYLGLAGDERVDRAAIGAIERYGTSASASRVASGERPVHRELEAALASFLGCEDAVVFASGHATNVTAVAALVGRGDLVLHDGLAHDSIVAGARLSGARRMSFPHNDAGALERMLRDLRPGARRVLIAVEGAYSMDGDLPPLGELVALRKQYGALLLVDEAHSLGCVGTTGRGIGEHAEVDRREVDVWMGTLSKSLASCGGYVAGSRALVEYLKYAGGGFVYAAAITPANAAAALSALRILEAEPWRVAALQRRAAYFLARCRERGVDTGSSGGTAIVPAIAGASVRCLQIAEGLRLRGINVQPILHPAVEEDRARLRFFLSALHAEEQLDRAAEALAAELARHAPRRAPVLERRVTRASPGAPESAPHPPRALRKVFVTGGTGFIGSRVVRRLIERGLEVRCLLRPSSRLDRLAGLSYEAQRGDLHDREALALGAAGCDALVHLACASAWSDIRAQGDRIVAVAVEGTRNVLEAARRAGVARLVHVSSVTALAGSEQPTVFDETAPYTLEGRGLSYSLAKHRAEQLVLQWTREGLDATIVLPAEVYGPDDDALVTAGNLVDILNASPPAACDGGTSVAHVDDVAEGVVSALLRGRAGERYILGGDNLTVHELTSLTLRLAGRRDTVMEIPNEAAVRWCRMVAAQGLSTPIPLDVLDYATLYWFVDSGKARRELGYRPRGAVETLRPVVEWLRNTGHVM
jgi:8-amino-7-oxononanoate synthase